MVHSRVAHPDKALCIQTIHEDGHDVGHPAQVRSTRGVSVGMRE